MISITVVDSPKLFEKFVYLPETLYKDDANWTPPLWAAEEKLLDRNKHPFHKHAKVEYFLANVSGKPVGRIAAIRNYQYDDYHETKGGFWGFFETVNDVSVARALLSAAEEWLKKEGAEFSQGPFNFSTNETCGMLVEGFERPAYFLMTYNPQYYNTLVDACGYKKVMDLLAFRFTKQTLDTFDFAPLKAQFKERIKNSGITIRHLTANLKREIPMLHEIYNDAWADNWGFVPMTLEEVENMAQELKPIIKFFPHLTLVMEREGKPIAFSIASPDLNVLIKKINGRLFPMGWLKFLTGLKKLSTYRVIALGIRREYQRLGLGTALYGTYLKIATKINFTEAEFSWILETNRPMLAPIERLGATPYKRYRIYGKPL